jgi:hypothetical protein
VEGTTTLARQEEAAAQVAVISQTLRVRQVRAPPTKASAEVSVLAAAVVRMLVVVAVAHRRSARLAQPRRAVAAATVARAWQPQ